jgi:SSS family solute:Na+ symporter
LFATFIIAMFWKRVAPMAGVLGLAAGTAGAAAMHYAAFYIPYFYPGGHIDPAHATINAQMQNFYGAIVAFLADAVVTVIVTYLGKPKPISQLAGLVWGCPNPVESEGAAASRVPWWESPWVLGFAALVLIAALSLIFV